MSDWRGVFCNLPCSMYGTGDGGDCANAGGCYQVALRCGPDAVEAFLAAVSAAEREAQDRLDREREPKRLIE